MQSIIGVLGLAVLLAAPACSKSNKAQTAPTTPARADTSGASKKGSQAAQPKVSQATPRQDGELKTVYFEFDSSVLSDDARKKLDNNAQWLSQHPGRALQIEGHTDEAGTSEYNLALGQRRAQAAFEYLLRLGVAPDRLTTTTYGEERPADPSAHELNRRSEFVPQK